MLQKGTLVRIIELQTHVRRFPMEKMMIEKYSPIQLFQLNPFKQRGFSSVQILPQMPPRQLSLFLEQSMDKKVCVTVQINSPSKKESIRECSGMPRMSSHTDQFFVLEDKKMIHLCPFSSVRHIRLAN